MTELQESIFLILVDLTLDITHTEQLCITLRYFVPVCPVERFVPFMPLRSLTGMGIAEVILTFLQEKLMSSTVIVNHTTMLAVCQVSTKAFSRG